MAPSRSRSSFRPVLVALVLVAAALAVQLPLAAASEQAPFAVQLLRVTVPTDTDRDRLTSLGLDLTEHAGPAYVEVVVHTADDLARLAGSGLAWTVTIPDLGLREIQNNQMNAAYAQATSTSPLPSGRDTYRTLAEYNADLRALAANNSGLAKLLTLSRQSVEGREILGVEISDDVASTSDGKPVFLMMGLHHAREWPSGEHAMEFAIDLVKGHASGDARITDLLKRTRVLVIPVVNVDGFEQSRKWGDLVDTREVDQGGTVTILGNPGNAYKRKNCRVADGQSTPPGGCEITSPGGYGIGIDLNRNYGGLWGGPGASDLFADPTYRGAGPFSEPETQAVRELISSRQVTTLITNHTFSNLVLRPPGIRSAGETVDEGAMKDLGAQMSAQNGYRNIHGWQLYDTTGTTEDWSYSATGGYGYTFEIGPNEFHPPFQQMIDEYLGAGIYTGKGNREAYLIALANAADASEHSVISGKAPAGAVLRLTKEFVTKTSQDGLTIQDKLESTSIVPSSGKFTWHVNPSTRPEVMEHRVRILAQEPTREETTTKAAVVWGPGDHVDIPFSMPETGVGALKVNLDWPTPDDIDLYVYHVQPDGSLLEVGSSGGFVLEKEEALVELPEPGNYVLRAENFASITTTFTMTAGLYGSVGEDVFGGGIVESYTLSCARPNGTVLQTTTVAVDRGKTKKVDLRECIRRFKS
ncbi:MAG: M14 family metallopeptidase [Gaiellaceae bacterium]